METRRSTLGGGVEMDDSEETGKNERNKAGAGAVNQQDGGGGGGRVGGELKEKLTMSLIAKTRTTPATGKKRGKNQKGAPRLQKRDKT